MYRLSWVIQHENCMCNMISQHKIVVIVVLKNVIVYKIKKKERLCSRGWMSCHGFMNTWEVESRNCWGNKFLRVISC